MPRLVFANTCFSAATTKGQALSPDEQSKGLASIAQAFFERGVSNYIGSGWPVDDEQATKLARTFYESLLKGAYICDALQTARAQARADRLCSRDALAITNDGCDDTRIMRHSVEFLAQGREANETPRAVQTSTLACVRTDSRMLRAAAQTGHQVPIHRGTKRASTGYRRRV